MYQLYDCVCLVMAPSRLAGGWHSDTTLLAAALAAEFLTLF
jgi:hypothetical protein